MIIMIWVSTVCANLVTKDDTKKIYNKIETIETKIDSLLLNRIAFFLMK